MAVLVVGGRRRPEVVPLRNQVVSVGRSQDNLVQLDHPDVSRYQCQIEPLPDGGHRVLDLRSTNGTYLNGERIRSMALEIGDQIIVGQVTLVYAADDVDPREELERVGGLFPWRPTSSGEFTAVRGHTPAVLASHTRMEVTGPTRRSSAPRDSRATHPLVLQQLIPHINRCGQHVESDLDLGNLLLTILSEILLHTAFERAILMLYDEETHLAEPVLAKNVVYELLAPEVQRFVEQMTKDAVSAQTPLFRCGSVLDFDEVTGGPMPVDSSVESVLCIPLTVANRRASSDRRRHNRRRQTLGVFYLDSSLSIEEMDEYEQELIEALAAQASTALQNAQLHYQATTDPMTRLNNREGMWKLLQDEVLWAQEHHAPLAVILLDLDHFKRINDTHGHPMGDEVLKRLARRIQRAIRTDDYACRWGGEEFLVLVPGVRQDGVLGVTSKIAEAISRNPIGEKRLWITASMGVALYPEHGQEPADLVQCADTALYHAKASGRNATCIFGSSKPVIGIRRHSGVEGSAPPGAPA